MLGALGWQSQIQSFSGGVQLVGNLHLAQLKDLASIFQLMAFSVPYSLRGCVWLSATNRLTHVGFASGSWVLHLFSSWLSVYHIHFTVVCSCQLPIAQFTLVLLVALGYASSFQLMAFRQLQLAHHCLPPVTELCSCICCRCCCYCYSAHNIAVQLQALTLFEALGLYFQVCS